MKIEGSGSIRQRHGSADPDPDPHQNIRNTADKAPKKTGVTKALDTGAKETEVMHGSRWRTSHIPLRYSLNSHQFKRSIVLKIPPLDRSCHVRNRASCHVQVRVFFVKQYLSEEGIKLSCSDLFEF
jgi:hypothetical protein